MKWNRPPARNHDSVGQSAGRRIIIDYFCPNLYNNIGRGGFTKVRNYWTPAAKNLYWTPAAKNLYWIPAAKNL